MPHFGGLVCADSHTQMHTSSATYSLSCGMWVEQKWLRWRQLRNAVGVVLRGPAAVAEMANQLSPFGSSFL